jgi:hypothetical protein
MSKKVQAERRRFLKAAGASALTAPFLRMLPSYAQSAGSAPTYLVTLFTPCGCVRPLWGATDGAGKDVLPPMPGSAPIITTGFKFRNTLAPLQPVQNSVILLDGLNVRAAQGSHEAGMAALWTGLTSTGAAATGPSIDQVITGMLNAGRPFPSLELMVRGPDDFTDREVKTRMIYNAAGTFVDPHDDPVEARGTIFPMMTAGTGPDKKTFIRQKLFGQLDSELAAIGPRLCNEDKGRLDALRTSWHALDVQIAAAATAAAKCTTPAAAPAGYKAPSPDFPTTAKLQMDILAMALACDLTRVASLQFSTSTSKLTHTWITGGATQSDTHHNYSHQGPTSLSQLAPCTSYNNMGQCAVVPAIYGADKQGLYQNLPQQQAIDLWYAQQVAYLASKLAALPGVNGGTLLDQTVICWGNELDMGAAHNHDDTPFVLIGGANGKLKTGRMVSFALDLLSGDPVVRGGKDRSHNDLLLTLAKAMGVNLTTFGDKQYCTGPIAEILT